MVSGVKSPRYPAAAATPDVSLVYWEKTSALCPWAASCSSRSLMSASLLDSPDLGSTLQICFKRVISSSTCLTLTSAPRDFR